MKHAFIMNCHANLPQAARCTALYRRYWRERSSLYLYYDGVRDYDQERMACIQEDVDACIIGPYEPHKSQSIFNAINELVNHAASRDIDVISFVHEDMIPLFRNQFYHFLDNFWRTGKLMTYSKMWPTLDCIDYCNMHFRLREALRHNLFPIRRIDPTANFNEHETTLSFDRSFPAWRQHAYPMWSMTWPLTTTTRMKHWVPAHWHQGSDKTGHDNDGHFVFHNYIPESSVMHVNDDYFWNNYHRLSDAEYA